MTAREVGRDRHLDSYRLLQEALLRFMGKRREPRKDIKVPVRIFGTDSSGQIFSEKVFTINVSRCGAELINVQARLNPDEMDRVRECPSPTITPGFVSR